MTVELELDSDDPAVVFADYPRVIFKEVFKISKTLASIYESLDDREPGKLFFLVPDCKDILMKYIQKEGLD